MPLSIMGLIAAAARRRFRETSRDNIEAGHGQAPVPMAGGPGESAAGPSAPRRESGQPARVLSP